MPTPEYGWWVTRDGRRIRVVDMATSHVYNTYCMLLRRCRKIAQYTALRALCYAATAPDGAAVAAAQSANGLFDADDVQLVNLFMEMSPSLRMFYAEVIRRDLNPYPYHRR